MNKIVEFFESFDLVDYVYAAALAPAVVWAIILIILLMKKIGIIVLFVLLSLVPIMIAILFVMNLIEEH